MVTLQSSIDEKYGEKENEAEDFSFIVFVSSSPEAKAGMFPPLMTLNDYNIESFGAFGELSNKIRHVRELDLTDNLLSDWAEIVNILSAFNSLTFLNLSNNLLSAALDENNNNLSEKLDQAILPMRKLVLNGNNVAWSTVLFLVKKFTNLEELHLSANNLKNPGNSVLENKNLKQLFLSCNPISDFSSVSLSLLSQCPGIQFLSLAECPIADLTSLDQLDNIPSGLTSLNVSTTKINSWQEVEKLRRFPGLNDLRIQGCPFLDELNRKEKRAMLVARLPNVKVLNGGDMITKTEREDSERAFIRFFLDTPEQARPERWQELVEVHGILDPLVNIDLSPDVNVKVCLYFKDECREEKISVRQTVKQFKQTLHGYFGLAPANMRLWYYDQEMTKIAGPEEMKFTNKELYTYNVIEGDYFVIDEKAQLKVLTGSPRANSMVFGSSLSPTSSGGSRIRRKSSESLISPNPARSRRKSSGRTSPGRTSPSPGANSPSGKQSHVRNLFGSSRIDQHYGEFFHSKVFPEDKRNKSTLLIHNSNDSE